MRPIIHEQDGVRVAVAVQVVQCKHKHAPQEPERSVDVIERAEDAALLLRFILQMVVLGVGRSALFLVGLGVWTLGRLADGVRAAETHLGGGPKQLPVGLLPWLRPDDTKALSAGNRAFDSGHRLRDDNQTKRLTS